MKCVFVCERERERKREKSHLRFRKMGDAVLLVADHRLILLRKLRRGVPLHERARE